MAEKMTLMRNQQLVIPIIWTGVEKILTYTIELVESGAHVSLLALLLGKESDIIQFNINVSHKAENTTSEVVVQSVLTGQSQVNFNGKVSIFPGAKKTKTWLAAHLLLLSNTAKGTAIPSLEILENDITAGHATTVGRIHDNELFYLMSRGIDKQQAKRLIIEGFLTKMVNRFPKDAINAVRKEIVAYDTKYL